MSSKITVPIAFASCSVGLPRHTLPQKFSAIASAGFQGVELSFPDLLSFANSHFGKTISEKDYDSLCEAGKEVRELCEEHKLKIIVLQPFGNFEGWPEGSRERDEAFERARGWIRIMEAVGTDMLQVGSTDSTGISSDPAYLSRDLALLADLLAPHSFRLAYENWCWATHAPTWKTVWQLVQQADRPNIGLCLDTFQTAGEEWGDPTTVSGRIETGGISETDLMTVYRISLDELVRMVPKEKIYFLQISDGYHVEPPLKTEPDESGLRPWARWSHDHRPLPYDGGYLPIVPFAEAVLATGFRGWFSVEVFDGMRYDKYGEDMEGYARKAREAHERMMEEVKI